MIARGVFTSVPDLKRKLMRYIRHYNKQPKAREVEVLRSITTNYSRFNCYSPLVMHDRNTTASFDHLVGSHEQRRRNPRGRSLGPS